MTDFAVQFSVKMIECSVFKVLGLDSVRVLICCYMDFCWLRYNTGIMLLLLVCLPKMLRLYGKQNVLVIKTIHL